MMLLEREYLDREITNNKIKSEIASHSRSPSNYNQKPNELSDDLYESSKKNIMVSKNVGAEGHRGTVSSINKEKSSKHKRDKHAGRICRFQRYKSLSKRQ